MQPKVTPESPEPVLDMVTGADPATEHTEGSITPWNSTGEWLALLAGHLQLGSEPQVSTGWYDARLDWPQI
jgi:hypothetical protein